MKKLIAATTLTLATAGLVGIAPPANADDDFKRRAGDCSGRSHYVMTLRDGDDDRLRTTFKVNSPRKAGKVWKFTVKRGKKVVFRTTKKTNRRGDVRIARTVRADDDARITVIARAGYGERCARGMRLDD